MAINVPLSAQLQNATQLQQQVQNAVNAVRINLGGPNGARALSSLSQPLGRLTGQADEFSKSLDAANARVLAFGASVGVVNAVSNAFKSLVNSTIEVEKAITAISVVGDQFNGKTKQLSQGLFNIAKTTGQSFGEVSKAALEFSRQGLNLEDTLARTNDALILTRTTGLESAKSVDGLTAAVNAFAKAGLSTTQVLNKLAAVDQAFAVSSADLIEAFQRTGAVAQQAGVSFDELAGIVTALQTETSRGGAVIGNALKTIFSRLQDTSTLTQLQDLGVAVQDLQGNLLPARQILQNLAGDVQGLSKVTQAGVFKDVAGTFQLNQLVSLVNDLNKAQSISAAATQKSAGATNEAYIANEKLNQSLDAILNKVTTTGKQLGSLLGEIGLTDNLKGLLDGVNSFLEDVNGVLQGGDIGSNFAKGFVKGIGAVLSGPGLGIFLAIIAKLSYDLLRFGAESLKTFFGIGKAARDQKQIQESIVQTLLKNQNVLNSILSAQGGQNAQGLKFLGILNQQAAAMQSIQGLAGNIAGTVYSAGYRQTDRGLAKKAAGGYLPAQEASDVRRGVGGASPSSKVVSIPNFAFGGGKRGTMVANTSEYIVPNYAGGGSAIFNQDMVKTMGLPAGAKKISAAGGFIPNFADQIRDVSSKYALIVNEAMGTQPIIASHKSKDGDRIDYRANAYGIDLNKLKNPTAYSKKFSQEVLVKKYQNFAQRDAARFADAAVGRPISPVSVQKLANAGAIPSLVGTIFESAIESIIQDPEYLNAFKSGGQNASFDFVNAGEVNDFFGIPRDVKYVEAKYRASGDALKSFGSKIYREEVFGASTAGVARQKFLSGKPLTVRQSNFADQLQKVSGKNFQAKGLTSDQISLLKKAGGTLTSSSASGYIPNFAAAALQQAIAREKSAGLSNSQIYVDQNSSLKSPLNPMGLMVANTRDEPFGGIQGISRARKEGINPKTYGAANGFVPNYAVPSGLSGYAASLNPPVNAGNVEAVNKGFADTAGKIFLLQSALSFLQGAIGDTEDSFVKVTNAFATASGNIASLALLGKEIQGIKIDGTGLAAGFGKFAKGLGIAGVAFGVVTEGFKFANFAIKEFSGENKRAADALAGLETAAQGALVSLNDLTPAGQRTAQETGKAALESFSGSFLSNLFSEAAGKNPRIQEQVGLLSAQGVKPEDLKSLLETEVIRTTAERKFGQASGPALRRTAQEKYFGVEDLGTAISNLFTNPEVKKSAQALFELRSGLAAGTIDPNKNLTEIQKTIPSLENVDPKIAQSILDKNKTSVEIKKQQVALDRDVALGERISLELAKQKLDNLLEQKKATIDYNAAIGTETLRFELETLDVSEKRRNEIEKQLKLKEIDNELTKKNIDLVKESIDRLSALPSDASLGVSVNKTNEIQASLSKKDIKNAEDLKKAVEEISKVFGLTGPQVGKVTELLGDSVANAESLAKSQKNSVTQAANFNAKLIDTKNILKDSQLFTERIVADLERASRVRLSAEGVGFNARENAIKLLRERASATTDTSEARRLNAEAAAQEIELNKEREKSSKSQFQDRRKSLEENLKIAREEYLKLSRENVMNGFNIDPKALQVSSEAVEALKEKLTLLSDEETIANQTFDNTTKTLDLQAQAIYRVVGASTALKNSLDQFRLGAGERAASAQLEALGATDINSLAKAGIKTDVEANASGIKDNAEYYKTIQEQTRLREIQFDLATAESEVRRRELQYELKYTQEIIDLKNKGATEQELIDARNRQISEQRSGARGFEKGLDTIQDRINNYRTTLGEEIPNLFSSNLSQGLNDAISGAKDLKTALTDAATSFFQEITKRNISNLADIVTGGLGKGTSSGGGILSSIFSYFGGGSKTTGLASGGFIKGGSGTKDDVPAMLMGGEYVVKKSAVSKYGKGFLDAINSGSMRGYATGGMVDPQTFPTQTGRGGFYTPGDYGQGAITGKNELLTFASQSFTGGQYDYMGGIGMGGATVSLEPESGRLSALGREGSPMFERVQQSKDEAFRVYLEGLQKEKEYSELLDQIAKDKKARKKELQRAIISAVISSALSYAGTSMKVGAANASAAGGSKFAGAFMGSGGKGGLFNIAKGAGTSLTTSAKALEYAKIAPLISDLPAQVSKQAFTARTKSLSSSNLSLPQAISANTNFINPLLPQLKAAGGLISGGSNIRDDVPAMLTGGEFVLNNRATQRLGVQNLNRLNSGAPVSSEGGASAEMTQALVSKLDELIQATSNSSKENVVVNVSTSEADGQKQENPAGAEKELHKKIRQAVLDVIAQEKRLGGSLEKSR